MAPNIHDQRQYCSLLKKVRQPGNADALRTKLAALPVAFGLSAPGFSRLVERAASEANSGIKAHAHMLRHACGYKLANDGHDTRAIQAYLGHRNFRNDVLYGAGEPAVVGRTILRRTVRNPNCAM
jgi:site-specific recombinase XerD